MCGLFLQHATSEGTISQNSFTSHDLCHSFHGPSHTYAHAAVILHFLLIMHTNLWCANWANNVVADILNPMPVSTSFSLACMHLCHITDCLQWHMLLETFPHNCKLFLCLEEAHHKTSIWLYITSCSQCILHMHCIQIHIVTAGDSHFKTSPLEWDNEWA